MGWLWGNDDPMKGLDPSLKKFLEEQAPKSEESVRSKPPSSTSQPEPSSGAPSSAPRPWSAYLGLSSNNATASSAQSLGEDKLKPAPSAPAKLPEQSLYQDGRYAELWKTYRPFAELDDISKSEQERLLDIIRSFRDRRKELGRTALENCASEQLAIHDCFRTGGWSSRMTMCRAETKALDRCIKTQSQLLTALGFLDTLDRSDEENERMQMHADKLYQRVRAQVAAADEAKENGLPVPSFDESLFDKNNDVSPRAAGPGSPPPVKFEDLPKSTQEKYEAEMLKGLEGMQRELAKREIEQDLAFRGQYLNRLTEQYRRGRLEQLDRREAGAERIQDKIMGYLDFRDWSKVDAEWEEMRALRKQSEKESK